MYIQVVKAEVRPAKETKKSSFKSQVNILIFIDLFLFLLWRKLFLSYVTRRLHIHFITFTKKKDFCWDDILYYMKKYNLKGLNVLDKRNFSFKNCSANVSVLF